MGTCKVRNKNQTITNRIKQKETQNSKKPKTPKKPNQSKSFSLKIVYLLKQ